MFSRLTITAAVTEWRLAISRSSGLGGWWPHLAPEMTTATCTRRQRTSTDRPVCRGTAPIRTARLRFALPAQWVAVLRLTRSDRALIWMGPAIVSRGKRIAPCLDHHRLISPPRSFFHLAAPFLGD